MTKENLFAADHQISCHALEEKFNQQKSVYDAFSYALGDMESLHIVAFAKLGKLQAIAHVDKLKELIESACERVEVVLPQVKILRDQLQQHLDDMKMTTSDLSSSSLQAFQAFSTCVDDVQALVQACRVHKVTLQAERLEA